MKFRRSVKPAAALGTCDTRDGPVTAHVEHDGERLEVLSCEAHAPSMDKPLPRGVAYDDLVGVLHRLDLPPADDATTAKLIAAQLETLIPGQADHVRWGWQRTDGAHPTLVYTVSRRRLEALTPQDPDEGVPELLTTPALALHQVFSHATSDTDRGNLIVIGWDRHRAHVIRYRDGQLESLDTLTLDQMPAENQPPHLAAWVGRHLNLPQKDGPESARYSFTLIGTELPDSDVVAAFEGVLNGSYRRAKGLLDLPGVGDHTLGRLVAVGTAIGALHPAQAINLAENDDALGAKTGGRPSRRRWIAAGAALLAALTLFCVSDLRRAERIALAVDEAALDAPKLAALNTDLKVASYLETTGPSFLAILDEFSHQTQGFVIDEMRYERNGQFTVRATGNSSDQVNQLAAKLSEMKTLSSVRIRSQAAKDRDKVEYTLVAVPSTRYMAPFAPPPRKVEPPKADQAKGESAQPAGPGPASAGGGT